MKKLMFILLNVAILLTLTIKVNGQHAKYFSKPSIYDIDKLENDVINLNVHDKEWFKGFYNALEKGINDPIYNDKYGKGLKSLLEDDNLTFIINGWLYVFSYEPNIIKSHNDEDYNVYTDRRVYLYRKNVRLGDDWEKACYTEFATDRIPNGINVKAYSFNPIREDPNQGEANYVIKSTAYENVVFVLYGVASVYNTYNTRTNQFIVLMPVLEYNDGKIDYEFTEYFGTDKYPQKFTGVTDNGKTLQTIDNSGKKCVINTKSCKDPSGKFKHICFTGDYDSATYGR